MFFEKEASWPARPTMNTSHAACGATTSASQRRYGAAFSPSDSLQALQSKRDSTRLAERDSWLNKRDQQHIAQDASTAASPHAPIPKIVGGRLGWLREQYLRNKSLVAKAEQELIQATLNACRPTAVLLPDDDDAPLTAPPILFDPKHAENVLSDELLCAATADAGQCESGSDENTTSDEEEESENDENDTDLQQDMKRRVLPVARPLKTSEFIAQYRPPPVELGKFSPFIEFNPHHADGEAEESSADDEEEEEVRRWEAATPITPTASNFLDELMGRTGGESKPRGRAVQVL